MDWKRLVQTWDLAYCVLITGWLLDLPVSILILYMQPSVLSILATVGESGDQIVTPLGRRSPHSWQLGRSVTYEYEFHITTTHTVFNWRGLGVTFHQNRTPLPKWRVWLLHVQGLSAAAATACMHCMWSVSQLFLWHAVVWWCPGCATVPKLGLFL